MANNRPLKNVKRAAPALGLALLLIVIGSGCGTSGDRAVKIGAPDGVGGILAQYVAASPGLDAVTRPYSVTPIQDCCSPNAQFALVTQNIDAAIVCASKAEALVKSDDRYIILGPCLANTDMLVIKVDPFKALNIGIAQDHLYQTGIIDRLLGPGRKAVPMMATALSYAYEKGEVDGVVIDVDEALRLNGTTLTMGGDAGDIVTYMAVARRDLPGLGRLTAAFRAAAIALSDPANLQPAIAAYSRYPTGGEEATQWLSHHVRFLALK